MSEYVMVPREPTEAMCRAGNDWTCGPHDTQGCYAAMLAAAPTPPPGEAVLPDWLLALIGNYGADRAGRHEAQALHSWQELIRGIKRYAAAAPREPAPDIADEVMKPDGYCPTCFQPLRVGEPALAVGGAWQMQLADALDHFWNPAVGAVQEASYHGPASGSDVIGAMAQGLAAVAASLREAAIQARRQQGEEA